MEMSKRVILILGMVFLFFSIGMGKELKFREYVRRVFRESKGARDLNLKKNYIFWSDMQYLSGILPQIDFDGRYSVYKKNEKVIYSSEDITKYKKYDFSLHMTQFLPTATTISADLSFNKYDDYTNALGEKSDFSNTSFSLSVVQNIYGVNTGYHKLKKWLNNRKLYKYNLSDKDAELLKDAYARYIDLLTDYKRYRLYKLQYERYKDIYAGAENKYELGALSIIDFNRIRKRFKEYEINYKEARRQYENGKKDMEEYLGISFNMISDKIFIFPISFFNNVEPEKKKIETKIALDNSYRDYKLSKYQNDINLYAGINFGNSDMEKRDYDDYTAYIALSIPVGNLSKISSLKKSKINYLLTKNRYKDQLEAIKRNFDDEVARVHYYHDKILLYRDILKPLKENYINSSVRFDMGTISLQELMNIEDEYINTVLNYLSLIKNYSLLSIDISSDAGILDKLMEEIL